MKGMTLSHMYYDEVITPFLNEQVSHYVNKIAAGLVGEGSECFGFDDNISKDHNWGARICLWVTDSDYDLFGEQLQKQLMQLPKEFREYPVQWTLGRSGVMTISGFFRKYINKTEKLQTIGDWLAVPESYLAIASNGEVFYDPQGNFSEIWDDLRLGYPEDIRLKKLAARCMVIGQAGQYNYPRLIQRGDRVAAELAKDEFIRAVISTVYLLNNRYTPFYKWMYHGMKQLPILGKEISECLGVLLVSAEPQSIIEEICRLLICEFHKQNVSSINENYMVCQGTEIHKHIENRMLRATDPWRDFVS